jgi:uncharacterized protein (DUF2141 family)
MSKSRLMILSSFLVASVVGGSSATAKADSAACASGKPSVLVRVSGIKRPSGKLKIGIYEAGRYLKRKGTVNKETVPVRSSGPLDVCLAVPKPGRYAVAIHHDLNANDDRDINDGAGYSNNPKLSLTNLKPAFSRTAVQVGAAPRRVGVVMQYRKGLSVGPVNG